jgi:hypothetical protein
MVVVLIGVFCTGKNRVVNIVDSNSEMVLQTTKHTMIYPILGPSLEVIPNIQGFDIKDEQWSQWGEQRAKEVHVVRGGE